MNKQYPRVSVITACYNDGPYILECVESVQNSGYPNIEHIIVDDGSNRETIEILKTIKYANVQVIYKDNGGVCSARNIAIEKSSGKYLLPLDGDDKISDNYIKDAVSVFESNPKVRVVTSEISQMFGCGDGQIKVELPIDMGVLLSRNLFTVTTMVKREDVDLVGGFDLMFKSGLEDWDFWISILSLGGDVALVPGPNFYYRIKRRHRNNRFSEDEVRNIYRHIWEKHKPLYSMFYADPFNTYAYQSLKSYKDSSLLSIINVKIRESIKKTRLGKFIEEKIK